MCFCPRRHRTVS
uniref:Uncharacterized protein n=1 Tax=Anguilla anguilla TaxID=7936 RepID=A0A0E9UXI6_ANGAN